MKYIATLFIFFALTFSITAQEVREIDETGLNLLLKSKAGKPVFVNLWATWCRPCVDEFPDILKIRNDYKSDSLEVILISLDFGEGAKEKAEKFLAKMNVDFVAYINAFSKDEDLINFFDLKWDGAIPATFIYDKSGRLSASMIGKRSYDAFSEEVRKVLN